MDPREWDEKMDIKVNVGLGTGNKDQQTNQLMNILALQKEGMAVGLANPQTIYNTLTKVVENAGFKSAKEFFTLPDPNQQQQGQDQGNPLAEAEMVKGQMNMEIEKVKQQAKSQSEMQKLQFDAAMKEKDRQLDAFKEQMTESQKMLIEQMKEENKRNIAIMEAEVKALIEGMKIDIGEPGIGTEAGNG